MPTCTRGRAGRPRACFRCRPLLWNGRSPPTGVSRAQSRHTGRARLARRSALFCSPCTWSLQSTATARAGSPVGFGASASCRESRRPGSELGQRDRWGPYVEMEPKQVAVVRMDRPLARTARAASWWGRGRRLLPQGELPPACRGPAAACPQGPSLAGIGLELEDIGPSVCLPFWEPRWAPPPSRWAPPPSAAWRPFGPSASAAGPTLRVAEQLGLRLPRAESSAFPRPQRRVPNDRETEAGKEAVRHSLETAGSTSLPGPASAFR